MHDATHAALCRTRSIDRRKKSLNLGASNLYQSFKQQYGDSKAWKYAWKRSPKEACSKSSGSLCSSNSSESSESYFKLLMAASPATFNNRDPSYTGGVDVVKPPKDQHPCKTCVNFAAISVAETAVAVVLQQSVRAISLSVQDLQFCLSGAPSSCRTGWRLEHALDALQSRQMATDDCLPYAPDARSEKPKADLCLKHCNSSDPDARIGQFSYVPIDDHSHAQRHIRNFGNVVTPFLLSKEFRDFFSNPANKNKVYKPGPKTHFEEGHAVVQQWGTTMTRNTGWSRIPGALIGLTVASARWPMVQVVFSVGARHLVSLGSPPVP
eukprot:jgi/Chrzof1/3735/Cz13g07010.t1